MLLFTYILYVYITIRCVNAEQDVSVLWSLKLKPVHPIVYVVAMTPQHFDDVRRRGPAGGTLWCRQLLLLKTQRAVSPTMLPQCSHNPAKMLPQRSQGPDCNTKRTFIRPALSCVQTCCSITRPKRMIVEVSNTHWPQSYRIRKSCKSMCIVCSCK